MPNKKPAAAPAREELVGEAPAPAPASAASPAREVPAAAPAGENPAGEVLARKDPARGQRPGYTRLFRIAEFRAVFTAHAASLFGVVVAEISLTVLVYGLTGSPLLSALTFTLGFLPYLVGGTLLSGIADRFPPRRVLVACDLVCAGCAALMALPATPVGALLALRCVIALVSPVFNGTRMATLTDVLGDGDLFVLGRSLLRIVSQSALLVGFGLGGVLLTVVSPRGALAITVVTFLCSATLLRLGTKARPARERLTGGEGEGTLLRYSLAGARDVLRHRRIRALLLLLWVPPMFVIAPEALAAAYADEIGAGSAAVGLLMCSMAVGTVASELAAGSLLSPAARSRIALPLASATLLPLIGYAAVPGVPWAVALLLLAGACSAYTLGLDRWFVDALPEELRGRAMTLHNAGLMTIQGVGTALAGAAAEVFDVSTVVAGAGLVGGVCCTALALEVRASGRVREAGGGPKDETGLTAI
ncbi:MULTISPECIES: MFS transporter [unclassified Streptomyces]|uniref:MFS transporter n=1 Tax=unclassified Streptomyces TaxID=2593676 RepID=UPI00278BFA71|nr:MULTISPECIES: MFS transporter [unclassified Streptomyces]